jgi:lysophospholipase L1-like esterase
MTSFLCISLVALAILLGQLQPARAEPATQPSRKLRIYLVGDSTVTDGAGWGKGFAEAMTDQVEVTNLSRGGRSSKSFLNEGRWKRVLEDKPDYVLIQFGHNDQKIDDPGRGTDPQTTYRQYMIDYVETARAAGVKPILVTSLSRRQWNKGGSGKIESGLTPYANVVKEIGVEKHVPVLDLHTDSIALYEKLGVAEIDTMSSTKPATRPSPGATEPIATVLDGTHLNEKGGKFFGRVVAEELAKALPELATFVRPKASE